MFYYFNNIPTIIIFRLIPITVKNLYTNNVKTLIFYLFINLFIYKKSILDLYNLKYILCKIRTIIDSMVDVLLRFYILYYFYLIISCIENMYYKCKCILRI